jgi:phosphopantothenoylcysteine decarboxylase/phosphopantothenate--cysteine ligase
MFGERGHPSQDIRGTLGNELEGRRIVLGITGSVAAVKSVEIARLLIRHGADVVSVMSPSAQQLIHPNLIEWATGNKVIVELTGEIEHVAVAGNVSKKADLIIVAPATANTISKIACGIDDTPVTTVVTTGIGEGIPLMIVPAMHEPMYRNPFVNENLEKLKERGITFLMPRVEEGKAKIADSQEILKAAIETLSRECLLEGRKVLITAGRTVEYLDPVRVISNNSTGKMGIALASKAVDAGADVTLVYGKGTAVPPSTVRVIKTDTAEDMRNAVMNELKGQSYDIIIAAAAVGDWKPKEMFKGKISTHKHEKIQVELVPTPKIIDEIKNVAPKIFLVAFRAVHDLTREELIKDARSRMKKARADLIAVNDVSKRGVGFESDTNELLAVTPDGETIQIPLANKEVVATGLIGIIASRI